MDVSAVSNPVHPSVAKPPTEAKEDWGPDNDADADDAGLTVKSFAVQPGSKGGLYL